MPHPILNIADVEYRDHGHNARGQGNAPEKFQAKMGLIGIRIGAAKLGYNVTVVPPGKQAFPFHSHRVNEEMFVILDGEGELRFGKERFPIKQGDVIACPAGGPEVAHQIINTSKGDLKYLGVSTKTSPEIVEYPDSTKFGILAEFPRADGKMDGFRYVGRGDGTLDYWEGE